MQNISYTVSTTLSADLAALDILRQKLLITPLRQNTELSLQWQAQVGHIYSSYILAHTPITHAEIHQVLNQPRTAKTPTSTAVHAYVNALRWIKHHWAGNPSSVTAGDIEVLATLALPQPYRTRERFMEQETAIQKFFRYISTQHDHPIITASVVHAYFLHMPITPQDQGKIARLASHLILAKHGYDIRGMNAVEQLWAADPKAYEFALSQSVKLGQLTPWLEYTAASVKQSYQVLMTQFEREIHGVPHKKHQVILTKRQQEIVDMLTSPDARLTNREVQLHFHISAITASRDLTRLTALGLLYAHGKGRAVHYTRV